MTSGDGGGVGGAARRLLRRADDFQRRHRALAFPVAVFEKFGDDRAGQLAALIAYYGFFSLFPLMLLFVTIVSLVVRDDPDLQRRLIDSALSQFPVVGTRIGESIKQLSGSTFALVVGSVGALWSGTAVVTAAQQAMDDVWDVPRAERPSLVSRVTRAVVLLVGFGMWLVFSTILAGLGSGSGAAALGLKVVSMITLLALSTALFAFAYRVLTVAHVSWRDALPGAIVAALAWSALLLIGGWIVDRQIRNASQVYGFFAIVIGLLFWIYLVAQVFLVGAEVNVVRARRLWPRSLIDQPKSEPDQRVLAGQAEEQRAVPQETVEVRFDERDRGSHGATR
jgi:membrane protein